MIRLRDSELEESLNEIQAQRVVEALERIAATLETIAGTAAVNLVVDKGALLDADDREQLDRVSERMLGAALPRRYYP